MCLSVSFWISSMRALLVVLGDLVVLEQLLELVVAVAAHLADGGARLLGHDVRLLHQVLAALFGEHRDRDADDFAVGGGVEAEVGVADGFLDRRRPSTCPTARRTSSAASGTLMLAACASGVGVP